MIEVIEENPNEKIDCPQCNSKLAYKQEDISSISEKFNLYGIGHITCPVCGYSPLVTFDKNKRWDNL